MRNLGFLSLTSFKTVLAFGFGLEGHPEYKLLGAGRGLGPEKLPLPAFPLPHTQSSSFLSSN